MCRKKKHVRTSRLTYNIKERNAYVTLSNYRSVYLLFGLNV